MLDSKLSIKRIALLAIFTTICFIGRLLFQFIPNVQPMTVVLILLTLNFKVTDGILVTIGSIFLTNIFLGMGPWTIFQIISYILILILCAFIKPFYNNSWISRILFAFIAFFSGFLYGFIISLFSYYMFGMSNFWIYYLQGLPFDFMHAIGNLGFFLILDPILSPLLRKEYAKFFIQ